MKKSYKLDDKHSTIKNANQSHLMKKNTNTIEKLNIDLNVDNYTLNDMKLFIRLSNQEEYDYYQLKECVDKKIQAISQLNLSLEEKSKIVNFIKRIHFSLKDKLNIKGNNNLAGIIDESYSITDLQQDIKKLSSVVQERQEKELHTLWKQKKRFTTK